MVVEVEGVGGGGVGSLGGLGSGDTNLTLLTLGCSSGSGLWVGHIFCGPQALHLVQLLLPFHLCCPK